MRADRLSASDDVPYRHSGPACHHRLWLPPSDPICTDLRGGDLTGSIPRGNFLERGSTGDVHFISPLSCPFNYGSVPSWVGLEGDLLDALVLGRSLPLGTKVRVKAWGAVILVDRGMTDDKLICSEYPLKPSDRLQVLRFF